jgi:hypothetical protein
MMSDSGTIIALWQGYGSTLSKQVATGPRAMKEIPGQRNRVIILGADPLEADTFRRLIESGPYHTEQYDGLAELQKHASDSWLAIILDIDSIPLDNRTIRNLTLAYPAVSFFCTSWERFHPEIKDSICYHLFACLSKPIDADELHYLLKCVGDDETGSGDPPGG